MEHVCSHTVRSYELDGYGHVNNAIYLNYLEFARITFLDDIGFAYQKFRDSGYSLVVTRVEIDYRYPAGLGDILRIRTSPAEKRLTGGTFRQIIENGDILVCEAKVSWVCLNSAGKPARLPEEFDMPQLLPEKNA